MISCLISKEQASVVNLIPKDSFAIKQLINQIIFLENQIDEVSKEIKELYDKLDSHLLSVPGVGVNLAPIILAEIGNINNFDKPSKLIAFAGAYLQKFFYRNRLLVQVH